MAAEKNFENRVKQFLKDNGAWFVKYWGGAAYTKSGIPDLIVCDSGFFVGVELKADRGKPTLLQIVNLRKIREAGGIGVLLYPKMFQSFQNFMNEKSKLDAWYLSNVEEQQHWEIKLKGDQKDG